MKKSLTTEGELYSLITKLASWSRTGWFSVNSIVRIMEKLTNVLCLNHLKPFISG